MDARELFMTEKNMFGTYDDENTTDSDLLLRIRVTADMASIPCSTIAIATRTGALRAH